MWIKVIYGLFLSTILGFGFGFAVSKITTTICKNKLRQKTGLDRIETDIRSMRDMLFDAFQRGRSD